MKKNVLFLAILAASFAACSDDANDSKLANNASGELGLSVSISNQISTRSLKDAFVNTDAIGVFVTGTGFTPKLAEYSYNGMLWASPALVDSKIFLSTEEATVYGFYPSSATLSPTILANDNTNGISVTVAGTENSFAATSQSDYMYATANKTVTAISPSTALAFKHGLSKISFIVNRGKTFNSPGVLSQVKLAKTAGFLAGTGVMSLQSGVLSGLTDADNITFAGTAAINAYNETTPSAIKTMYGLVAPVASTTGITLTMTIDEKIYTATLPSAAPADAFVAGNDYVYTVTVYGTELILSSVTVTPWETKEGGSVDMQ